MNKLNLDKIAKYTNIPQSTLRDFQNRKVKPSKTTINRIMESLQKYSSILDYAVPSEEPKPVSNKIKKAGKPAQKPCLEPFINTGPLTPEEINYRVAKLDIVKCPQCGGVVKAQYSRFKQNHFLGCQNWRSKSGGCTWTKTLIVDDNK